MEIEIYRSYTKSSRSIDTHEEICRACAKKELKEGFEIEFDKHLSKYIHNEDGISYYGDGESDEEIGCSICGNSFKGLAKDSLLDEEFITCI